MKIITAEDSVVLDGSNTIMLSTNPNGISMSSPDKEKVKYHTTIQNFTIIMIPEDRYEIVHDFTKASQWVISIFLFCRKIQKGIDRVVGEIKSLKNILKLI